MNLDDGKRGDLNYLQKWHQIDRLGLIQVANGAKLSLVRAVRKKLLKNEINTIAIKKIVAEV